MKKSVNFKFLVLDVDGTLTDGGVYVTDSGSQFKKFNAHDGLGIKLAMQAGIEVGIISHSYVIEMVNSRANTLGLRRVYVGQSPKLEVLDQWLEEMELSRADVAFIGDDLNDLEIIQSVGYSACPRNAVTKVKDAVDTVLQQKGGDGAVREFVDRFILD